MRQRQIALIFAIDQRGDTRVQAHAHFDGRLGPRFAVHRTLRIQRRLQSIARGRKGDEEGIAHDLEYKAMVRLHRRAHDLVMPLARRFPLGGMRLRQLRAAFNIGEQERDRTGRKVGHWHPEGLRESTRLAAGRRYYTRYDSRDMHCQRKLHS